MSMRCQDTQKFLQPYLDGEFDSGEKGALEAHLSGCGACQRVANSELSFRKAMRESLATPSLPNGFRDKIVRALDETDAQARPSWAKRTAPFAGIFAAAAAAAFFFGSHVLWPAQSESGLVKDAVRVHQRNLPSEVSGDKVDSLFAGRMDVPVHPPRHLQGIDANMSGARFSRLMGRDSAQVEYNTPDHRLSLHIFAAKKVDTRGARRHRVGGRVFFVGQARGYNVVYTQKNQVGYVFTSDIKAGRLMKAIAAAMAGPPGPG